MELFDFKPMINWEEVDINNRLITDYLNASQWREYGIGIYINDEYKGVEFIDTMTDQFILQSKNSVKINDIEGIKVISNKMFAVDTLEGLKNLLKELNK